MSSESRTIYFLEKTEGFAEPISTGQVVPLDPTVVMFRGIYLSQFEITSDGAERRKSELSQHPAHTLLRPVPSSDGPPYWSALVYRQAGAIRVRVRSEHETIRKYYAENNEQAVRYHAHPPGAYAWESDISSGKAGYFLTGTSGPNALWRITRIQVDALNRQVLTFAPVQLAPILAIPKFDNVPLQLREYLVSHLEGLQQALTRNAPFDAIDRANNLTEGILRYCLDLVGLTPSGSLSDMLAQAKTNSRQETK